MKVIWKYPLRGTNNVIRIGDPQYKILHVGEQNGVMMIWIMHDPNREALVELDIKVVGTGFETSVRPEDHIGTIQMKDGHVWHIFK